MLSREKAVEILQENMQSPNLRRHCLAVEAVMRALARRFGEDEEKWGIVGLLHDGDYEKTKETPEKHTLFMVEWLKEAGETDPEIFSAILSHNYAHIGQNFTPRSLGEVGPPKNNLEWSLYSCDELTGLVVAVTLVRPDKKLAQVSVESIMKKWGQKSFAAGVKREQIAQCQEKLGIPLNEFVGIALSAMQGIAGELGL